MIHFEKNRLGEYTSFIYFLLFLVVLEFVGLAWVLISPPEKETPEILTQEDLVMPDWLEPVEETEEAAAEKQKPAGEADGPEILAQNQIITHGMGGVDDDLIVLNCLEGFQTMYAQGVRVFEADLRLTSDGKVILRHDWRKDWQEGVHEANIPTREEFEELPILDQYTPLSFRDLLLLMEEYPDICVVTDSKFMEAEFVRMQFDAMVEDARELGLSYLLDRFVVQIYSPLMFQVVDSVHHFRGYIYTLYMEGFDGTEDTFRRKAAYCSEKGILGITLAQEYWSGVYADIAQEYGLAVYTHTVDGLDRAKEILDSGASGVYTDFLTPGDLEETPEEEETETDAQDIETDTTDTEEGEES